MERIRTYAGKALAEFGEGKAGEAFTQAVLAITVNTGFVSHMVEDAIIARWPMPYATVSI